MNLAPSVAAPESAPDRTGGTPVPTRGSRSARLGIGLLVTALLLLPAVVAIVLMTGRTWYPVRDFALIDLSVRDVWSLHPPLTGLVSRNHWNHPGPAMFWLIGLFSGVTGQAAWATRVGGTLLQAIALGWLAWVTWRHSVRMLLAAATVTGLTYLAVGPWLFVQPWNIWVPLPFFILFVFLVCITAAGSFRQLIAMSLVGTLILQTHVGYAPLIAAGFLWVAVCAVMDSRRAGVAPARWRSTVLISGVIWLVSWIPPALDVVLHWPGNLGHIVNYFLFVKHPNVGLGDALGFMAAEFRFVPPWLGGQNQTNGATTAAIPSSVWWLVVPCALVVVGILATRGDALRMERRMVSFAAILVVVGSAAIARVDEPLGYHFQWRVVIAAFLVVATAWSIWAVASARFPSGMPTIAIVGAVVVVVGVVAWGSISQATTLDPGAPVTTHHGESNPLEARAPALARIMTQLRRRGLPHVGPVLVYGRGGINIGLLNGVVNELDRSGVDVRVKNVLGPAFGSQHTIGAQAARQIWSVTEDASVVPRLLALPGAHLIASVSPLSPAKDRELARLQRDLSAELERAHRPDLVKRVDRSTIGLAFGVPGINRRVLAHVAALDSAVERSLLSCRCAVVAQPGPAGS